MLLTGTENSPINSSELVESKSFTHIRNTANSGQYKANLKFSFQTGLNLNFSFKNYKNPPIHLPIVVNCSCTDFAFVTRHTVNFHTHIWVDYTIAIRLRAGQILAAYYLQNACKILKYDLKNNLKKQTANSIVHSMLVPCLGSCNNKCNKRDIS